MIMNNLVKLGQLVAVLLLACGSGTRSPSTEPPNDTTAARLEVIVSGLQDPVHLSAPPGDTRLFVVEQRGTIRVVKNGQLLSTPFLDVRPIASGGERGLLSVAFHPAYATNGYFYVNYTDVNGDTRVERYHANPASDVAEPQSAKLILAVDQPFSNHNGGHVLFGPDGMLYIGMGDGGSGGDPQGHGQNRGTLLGALLRIDVDGGDPYRIPADNPYVNQPPFRGEIWAWGLRNPWRSAFDAVAGTIYVADVGQNQWEEVNVRPAADKGVNYGWNIMEGRHCYNASSCNQSGLTLPVLEYNHSEGCSITGGFVYRGSKIPALQGHYFYADYCRGQVHSFKFASGAVSEPKAWDFGDIGSVPSFGEDANGELYVLSSNGTVYRLTL
jgi:hypothetical protein